MPRLNTAPTACTAQDALQPLETLERKGIFARMFVELAKEGERTGTLMTDATYLKGAPCSGQLAAEKTPEGRLTWCGVQR